MARAAQDWPEADRLRSEIEAAGWKVVDQGTRFKLERAGPPDVEDEGRVRYGRSASVPSRLNEPPTKVATVVVRATDAADDLVRALEGLRRHAPADIQVVVVADAPAAATAAALEAPDAPAMLPIGGEPPEVVWTVQRLGPAAAANAGLRRAVGAVVVLLDPSVELSGDALTPLVRALDDPTVALVGAWGSASADLRRWEDARAGDVDAIDTALMAFRRGAIEARGTFDERLRSERHLATWWSLVLRDEGEDHDPRRAVALQGLPVVRHQRPRDRVPMSDEEARLEKRDFYRVIDRFGRRRDLLVARRTARGPARG